MAMFLLNPKASYMILGELSSYVILSSKSLVGKTLPCLKGLKEKVRIKNPLVSVDLINILFFNSFFWLSL